MSTATLSKTPVKVLNASYEPLSTTLLKRAMALVIRGEAVVEEEDSSRIIHSIDGTKRALPLVIRMLKFVRVPFAYAEEIFSSKGVLRRDNFKCGYCRKEATTHDHIFPKSRGGEDSWMNAIAACKRCNGRKDDRTPEEAFMPLLFQPTVPMRLYMRSNNPRRKAKR